MEHLFSWIFWGGPFLWQIFFGVAVVLVWLSARDRSWRRSGHDTALDILKERFARGEITKEEYEERRRILEQG